MTRLEKRPLFFLLLGLLCLAFLSPAPLYAREKDKKTDEKPLILVINYPYQIWSIGASKIHVCLFTPDFKPAQGAEVEVDGKKVATADQNGVAIFEMKPGARRSHSLVATLKGKEDTYRVRKAFSCNTRTASFRTDQVYVYTDRGVYSPGQDILLRLIAWELTGDYAPISKAKVQMMLQNNQGKVFTGGWLTTNEYGVAAGEIPLSDNMPEGSYQLVVLYKKAREVARLRIKRFMAPVLGIRHNLKRFLTEGQDTLPIEVNLSYFSGGKIKSSSLVLEALNNQQKEIFRYEAKEKKPGQYSFSLSKGDLDKIRSQLQREQSFQFRLTATDSYGRTDKVIRDVVYTSRPYRAVLELDKDDYPTGEVVKLLVKVIDLDGKPATNIPLSLTVPQFKIDLKSKTDGKGVGGFSFKMGKTSAVALVKSPIMKALLGSRAIPINRPKPMVSKVEDPTNKAGIETLFVVKFDPRYIPVEKVVHVDMTDISGGLIVATTIPVLEKDGKHIARGKVSAPTWGTMLVNLYCCGTAKENEKKPLTVFNVGFITEGQKITLYPDKELSIEIENFRPRVRPGEKLELTVRVKNKKGQEACLGAAMVDSAVLSLLNPLEKTPRDRFYNPQLKVIASQGAGVLTWPVVDRNWGNPWRDIAYSNWGFKNPGGMVHTVHRKPPTGGVGGGSYGYDKKAKGKGGYPGPKIMVKKPTTNSPAQPESPAPPSKPKNTMALKKESLKDGTQKSKNKGLSFGDDESDSAKSTSGEQAHRSGRAKGSARPKVITIRTKFPETALWEPLAFTKGGVYKFTVKIPDSITIQRLSIMASDKQGGIGLLQKDIQVRQELFVRSGLPAVITLGDTLVVSAYVRNFSGKKQNCSVSLFSKELEILSEKTLKIDVDNGDTGVATWQIRSSRCGPANFSVKVAAGDSSDREDRKVFVQPAGEASIALQKGVVEKGKPWQGSIEINPQSSYHTAFLNVSFPNIIPAIQGMEQMARYPHGCVEQISSIALTNLAVLEYGLQKGMDKKKIQWLRRSLQYAAGRLAVMQGDSGGWGWFYLSHTASGRRIVRKANLYLTNYALGVLAEIRSMDLVVSSKALEGAMDFLLKNQNKEGLWSSGKAFFWEKTNLATDKALSAEVFSTLVKTARLLATKKYDGALGKLKEQMVSYLKEKPQEPLGIANAVTGLLEWARWKKDKTLSALLTESVQYLISLKRTAYWEPHWYHAYGGMVELNARILDLLKRTDGEKYQSFLREGVTWLLSTREAFGAWHNTKGTAAAVRALLKIGAFEREIPSTVSILINGKNVKEIKIDPADPFLSAASLRYMEITSYLKKGEKNIVEIQYNGNLKAPIIVEVKEWGLPRGTAKKELEIKRTAAREVFLGDPLPVSIEVSSLKGLPFVVIEERIPSNAEVSLRSLEKLKGSGKIADFRLRKGVVFFYLNRLKGKVAFQYSLTAIRVGKAHHPGIRAEAMYNPLEWAAMQGDVLEVKP